jgi:hypothetical protein
MAEDIRISYTLYQAILVVFNDSGKSALWQLKPTYIGF